MEPRLASSILVGALIRRAEAEGGFGAVIARGEPIAGSVMVVLRERGRRDRILERILDATGNYQWAESGPRGGGNEEQADKFLARRREFDPDLWIIELDIASGERFAAEMNGFD